MESNAPNCLRVVIPLVAGSTPLVPALQIGPALVSQVRKMNGRARCLRTGGVQFSVNLIGARRAG